MHLFPLDYFETMPIPPPVNEMFHDAAKKTMGIQSSVHIYVSSYRENG